MKNKSRITQLILGTITIVVILILHFTSNANSKVSFTVKVTGKGNQALILIPGLTCPGAVWNETVAQFENQYSCHVISLPGFGGVPPIESDHYLQTMRDELITYIKLNKLKKPILIGHSLGGFLSLWVSTTEPDLIDKIIIVDALPFFPAIQNPSATAESNKPVAENMRSVMANATKEQVKQNQKYFLPTMATAPDKLELIGQWGIDSHQPTVAQAMYEMQTVDLRKSLASSKANVLILGAWVAYKNFGVSKESTLKTFTDQYALLTNKQINLSDIARHFIMYDDPEWFYQQVKNFIN